MTNAMSTHRIHKGLLAVRGNPRRVVLQAVHELYDREETTLWVDGTPRINRLVCIGKNLEVDILRGAFNSTAC
ncbi:putative COBW domain-containing protein 7 [Saccoglossus kowalevskii]